ncbi:MAG: alpha/beta hydrolase [Dehalococcoidia bacterium]
MAYARVNGVDLYYEEHGEGPPLIFAHGLMGSTELGRAFGENIEAIAERGVRVIAYDARGHGRSGHTTRRRDYRWSSLAEDMLGVMHARGLERASVYGASMGAGTALVLALAHPAAVDKLILRAPPPMGEGAGEARKLFGTLATMYQFLGPRLTSAMLMRMPQVRAADAATPGVSLRAFFASQRRERVVPAIRGVLFDERLPVDRFSEIAHQALVLTHPGDPIHPEASGRMLYEAMPHARLAAAPTRGYWQENPDALSHAIAAFVRGEPIARGLPQKVRHEQVPVDRDGRLEVGG